MARSNEMTVMSFRGKHAEYLMPALRQVEMERKMAGGWRKESTGDLNFFKFDTPGQELVGKWRGLKEGKYGDNGVLVTKDDGAQCFSLSSALEDLKLKEIGTTIKLVYLGKENLKGGKTFKQFDIFTWDTKKEDGDDAVSDHDAPVKEPFEAGKDDVPF